MPKDDPKNPNGEKPESQHFERSPVNCQGCGKTFEHFIVEKTENLVQLRCGDVIFKHAKMVCLHCGSAFSWDVSDKKLEEMAVTYGELVGIKRYKPE